MSPGVAQAERQGLTALDGGVEHHGRLVGGLGRERVAGLPGGAADMRLVSNIPASFVPPPVTMVSVAPK
jgi:hypothetical protein